MEKDKKPEFDLEVLKKVLMLAKPYKKLFWTCLFMAIIMAPVANIRPILIGKMVDDNIFSKDIDGLQMMAIIYLVFTILNALLRHLSVSYTHLTLPTKA